MIHENGTSTLTSEDLDDSDASNSGGNNFFKKKTNKTKKKKETKKNSDKNETTEKFNYELVGLIKVENQINWNDIKKIILNSNKGISCTSIWSSYL